jgi:hypothetical protein
MSDSIEDIYNFMQLSDRLATGGQPTIDQYPAIAAAGYSVVFNLALTDSPNALLDEASIALLSMPQNRRLVMTVPRSEQYPLPIDPSRSN